MTTTTPTAPAPTRPIVPQPLWERSDLFREPAYPEGSEPLEDDEDD
jgi:hypothetical protein